MVLDGCICPQSLKEKPLENVLIDLSQKEKDDFFDVPMKLRHRMEDSGMFTDAALAELIERHPLEHTDVCTMGENPQKPNEFRTGDPRGLSGAELVQAVHNGDIWINLRKVTLMHEDYRKLLDGAMSELQGQVPGFKVGAYKGGILISSKSLRVPYHADQTITLLWHVRGIKNFFVYPVGGEFLPDKVYESIILGETTEDVPYKAEFEKGAKVMRLEPGELAVWPLNAPHKVENETFCVSFTVDCPTRTSAVKNSVYYANGLLRRKYGKTPRYAQAGSLGYMTKAAMGAAMRKLKMSSPNPLEDFVTFKVDPNAPGCIADTPPVVRNF